MLLAAVALACLWALPGRAQAAPPAGFQETQAFTGLTNPSAIAFAPAPDGRVFIGEKSGLIKVFSGLGDTSPTTFADLRTEVHNFWDRGLLGMVLDPQFPADPYLYVLYTRDAMLGGAAPPRWGTAGQTGDPCPTPPGPTSDGCVVSGRLARLTASGDVSTATTPLITDWCQQYPSHSVGDLAFGADGSLYVSGGDGASFTFADWGQEGDPVNPCGDPPGPPGTALAPPTAEGGALRSQDIRTAADPTTLDGSILRVNPDTGLASAGNPFSGSPDANRARIIANGQRNPFRITVRPGTNELWSGDVGWSDWEEINRVVDPGGGAENFGWPCYEGQNSGSLRHFSYDPANLNICENLYAPGDGNVVAPYFAYDHADQVVGGESCPTGSSSISGLDFYQSGGFPNSYAGALFFADYSRDCIWAMRAGANGLPNKADIQTFNPGAANPVDIEIGPQGDLFYADFDGGTIRRIVYTAGNQPPNAVLSADPSSGAAPLAVHLDASGSSDPDDAFATLAFAWDADNDGQFDDGTGPALDRTYAAGSHTARVRVSDPDGASDIDSVAIQADNTPPVAQINAPTGPTTWAVDDQVGFSGSASDAQQTLPASAFDWEVVINHCPSNCHDHTAETFENTMNGFFFAPDHEYPSTLTIRLTVTDQGGLTDVESVTINPRTVNLTLGSSPAGLQLGLNSETASAPFTRTLIEGSQNTVIAPTPQSSGGQSWNFGSWSDGGGAAHNVTVDATQTLTATFSDVAPPPAPQIMDTDPDSPADDDTPAVKGSAGGDAAVVHLYAAAGCTGAAANSGSIASFTSPGITVSVPSDTTTQISARSADAAGNESPCSAPVAYTEDSSAPDIPVLTATSPQSPANHNAPLVLGNPVGDADSIELYVSADCSGPVAATGTPAALESPGVSVTVGNDTTTSLSARSTDGVNASSCSNSISYREDSTPPQTLLTDTPSARIPFRPKKLSRPAARSGGTAGFEFSAAEPVPGYRCKLDGRAWEPCSSPRVLTKLKRGKHLFSVAAVDLAGNVDPTPASHIFKVIRKRAKTAKTAKTAKRT